MSLDKLRLATPLVLVALGCGTVGDDYATPEPAIGELEAWDGRLDGVLTDAEMDPAVLAEWWTTLEDDTLDSLVSRAAEANLDLRTASAQLRAARAQRLIAESQGSPEVSASAGATRTETDFGGTDLFAAGVDASWELDLFGGIARGVEAADADLQAAEEARRDVLVTVLSEVALNYVELRTLQQRELIARANLASQQESLDIVQAQLSAGAVSLLDISQARANVEATRSLLPALEQQVEQVKNRLAVLLGATPGALESELSVAQALPVPSVRVAVGVPAEVLRRRPDVRRSERLLAAETARVGVAVAELYPKFSLGGTVGLESASSSNLFDAASRVFSLGPRLQWPIFNGGRIRQQIEVQNARQEEALVEYERTILIALEDVQNAVNAFALERIRYLSLEASYEASKRAAELALSRYGAGETDFLNVLDSQRAQLAAQDELAQSEGTILANLVRLYKALGGGWDPEAPPEVDGR